jgi:hypothetical protein
MTLFNARTAKVRTRPAPSPSLPPTSKEARHQALLSAAGAVEKAVAVVARDVVAPVIRLGFGHHRQGRTRRPYFFALSFYFDYSYVILNTRRKLKR